MRLNFGIFLTASLSMNGIYAVNDAQEAYNLPILTWQKSYAFRNLGAIKSMEQKVKINFLDRAMVYTFIPTTGVLKNKEIKMLLTADAPSDLGLIQHAIKDKDNLYLYKHISNDKWLMMGILLNWQALSIKGTVKPDGVIALSQDEKIAVIDLATVDPPPLPIDP